METRISAFDYLAKQTTRDIQADDKKIIKTNSPSRIFTQLEIESEILTLFSKISGDSAAPLLGMSTLVQSKLFQKRSGAWPLLQFNWLRDGKLETISVRAYARTESNGALHGVYTLDFRVGRQRLMTLGMRGNRTLQVGVPDSESRLLWPLTAIHEVVDLFNILLQAHKIQYGNSGCITVGTSNLGAIKYSGEEFERHMTKLSKYNLTCRLNSSVVAYLPPQGNTYQFKMDWFDAVSSKQHRLNVTFVRGEKFVTNYSRFLTENNLLNLTPTYQHVKPGQLYYSLKIEQSVRQPDTWSKNNIRTENYSELTLLSMWFTLDGLVGEIRAINPGENLSGNEVLRVYEYFARLLKIENVFIYDDATLEDTVKNAKIPLRAISAIATGKTWFEKLPGVRLFEGKHLPVGAHDVISQNSFKRDAALKELQGLPLEKWYSMLDKTQQKILYGLHQYYWPRKQPSGIFSRGSKAYDPNPAHFGDMTLKNLAERVYQESKKHRRCTLELSKLNDLLCGTVGLTIDSLRWVANAPDYWVKSRIYQLLWGSLIWQQNGNLPEYTSNLKQLLR